MNLAIVCLFKTIVALL